MKKLRLLFAILALTALACGAGTQIPTVDLNAIQTIAANTLTAMAPTKAPPTFQPFPTHTPIPTVVFPTLTPVITSGMTRIQFAPGGISATVKNTVNFPNRVDYVLKASQTQLMTVTISSDSNTANFLVFGLTSHIMLKRLEDESRTWFGPLPATEDYVISVAVPEGSTAFTLTVTIVWP